MTKYGFERCEFEDEYCEHCGGKTKEIYFRSTGCEDSREGEYWCMPCIKQEELDNEEYEKHIKSIV